MLSKMIEINYKYQPPLKRQYSEKDTSENFHWKEYVFKPSKERNILRLCSNLSGSLITKPMVINHYSTPRVVNYINKIPLFGLWWSNNEWLNSLFYNYFIRWKKCISRFSYSSLHCLLRDKLIQIWKQSSFFLAARHFILSPLSMLIDMLFFRIFSRIFFTFSYVATFIINVPIAHLSEWFIPTAKFQVGLNIIFNIDKI